MNGVSKKKFGATARGAFSGPPIVAEANHGSGSPKLEGLAEAIPSSSTGVRPGAAEEPLLFCQSDVGDNAVSECVGMSFPPKRRSSTRELPDATGLILGPDSDLRTDRDNLLLCSSSHGTRLVQVSESPSALLHSQRTANSCATRLGYGFASPPLPISSPSGSLSGSLPLGSFGLTLCTSRSASARMHPDRSVPTHVAPQPSLVPLPSIYWLLFDSDEHSINGRNATLRGPPLSPLGELGGSGVAAASPASATPVSFLASWEDILTLERSARSSFAKNLSRARPPEVALIEQDASEYL
ncbi:hypothetical protein EI94DRAFT_1744011 [Lactarius quietus]|nr:hypothetical protein EI94DRAFT_1744011 [Lactarius quietus]